MATRGVIRMLVTLDGTGPNEQVLRIMSRLLGPGSLEVTGLYVEDEDLLRAAGLPCFREVSFSGAAVALDTARLAREMADEAAAARRAFEALAERLTREHTGLGHQFTVARGQTADVFDRAATESDFVMVTRALRGVGMRHRFGRTFAGLIRQPKDVLFVNEPWATGSSVVVLHSGDLAVDYATRLAQAEGLRLVVATPIGVAPSADRLPANVTFRQLANWHEQSIADLCLREDARLLVMPQLPDLDWAELLVSLMDRLPCSLLKLAPGPEA